MNTIAFMPLRNMLEWEPERMCEYIADAGYNAIEVQSALLCGQNQTAQSRLKFIRAVERAGIVISNAVMQRDFVLFSESNRKIQVEDAIKEMHIMADLGINIFNMYTGPCTWVEHPIIIGRDISQGDAWGWVYNAFDELIPAAEKLGVCIALENVWGMLAHNMYTNKFLHQRYESKAFGVTVDPSHDIIDGMTDMKFLVEAWGKDKIFHVHLKDAAGTQNNGQFLFPLLGEGITDWKSFFGALRNIGYQGAMSVEFESWNYLDQILEGKFELVAPSCRKAVGKLMVTAQ